MQGTNDTEITLGAGKLLGLFAGLTVVCGLFFGVGFMLGRSSAPSATGSLVSESVPAPVPANTTTKPSPMASTPAAVSPAAPADGNAQPTGEPAQGATAAAPATSQPAQPATPAPEVSRTAAPPNGGIMVQVAAVTKQQDAEALAAALRRKSYEAFISPPGVDPLYHVQLGPFSDLKDAEAMRARLQNDGYAPMIKR